MQFTQYISTATAGNTVGLSYYSYKLQILTMSTDSFDLLCALLMRTFCTLF